MQSEIHARIAGLFPSLRVEGWDYKGFAVGSSEGEPMLRIRFVKPFAGKLGFCDARLSLRHFNDRDVDLRGWLVTELQQQDHALTNRRLSEMAA